jgi:hypothetical protein
MARQLHLLEPPNADWHLDERTRATGRQGIATARAVLDRLGRFPADTPDCPPPAAA